MIRSFRDTRTESVFEGDHVATRKHESTNAMRSRRIAVHPGEILAHEFLAELGMSQYRLALSIRVPPRRINEIVLGKRSVSADTALRLARFLGTTPEFWLNLQASFDLRTARARLGTRIHREIKPHTVGD
jgi:addiction module HigA family antidote